MRPLGLPIRTTCALAICVVWLAVMPAAAGAQSAAPASGRTWSGLGYIFGGIGAVTGGGSSDATLHVGGGFEATAWDALGIGAEIGYLAPFESLADGIGIFSVNAAYHFFARQPSHRARPFVTGGYTLGFRSGSENLWNVGGGVDYWFRSKTGLRIEFRDHVWTGEGTEQFWGVRIGLIIR